MRDLGSQNNFVKLSVADKHNFKILENDVKVRVTGFNSSKEFVTKLVEMPLVISGRYCNIPAICTTEFNISLNLPGISSLARKFVSKNYELADEFLLHSSDKIQDLHFVLGTKSAYCLKTCEVSFGARSVYADSDVGALLLGDLPQMLVDIESLSMKSKSSLRRSKKYSKKSANSNINRNETSSLATISNSLEIKDGFAVMNDYGFDTAYETHVNFLVMDSSRKINDKELKKAAADMMKKKFDCGYTNREISDGRTSETDRKLANFALNSAERYEDGRLQMPLLWNSETCNSLGSNKALALAVLNSNRRKLVKNKEYLDLMDQTFKTQEENDIIERIENAEEFLADHPEHSFLCHMGVFRLSRETTKCRVVFLSNLCQQSSKGSNVSHNQAMFSGPSLNMPITSALLHLRFGTYLLVYDLCKAFNQISLSESDRNKLLFFWHRNVGKSDFTPVLYRNIRLSFGLPCSPFLLMVSSYKILVFDAENDDKELKLLKRSLYQLMYMDNGGILSDSEDDLLEKYAKLDSIFNPYKFSLQQFSSNSSIVQKQADEDMEMVSDTPAVVKLLGSMWDRVEDTLCTVPMNLDINANTKRLILKTVAAQYDIYNLNGPIINRSRLFLHRLQCSRDFGWDTLLPGDLIKEWKNIVRQANSSPVVKIQRCVGSVQDSYRLVACTDASKQIYGVVVYLHNLATGKVSFVQAKNRIVNSNLCSKSVPSLELQAILLGVNTLVDLHGDLCGDKCMIPMKLDSMTVYTDSLVSLHWLDSSVNKLEKSNKKTVFVNNRIAEIQRLCSVHPVEFRFITGVQNPGDCITRSLSHKQLSKTNYVLGPNFSHIAAEQCRDVPTIIIPNPEMESRNSLNLACLERQPDSYEPLAPRNRFSKFGRFVRVYDLVIKFVNKLKSKLNMKFENSTSTDSKLFIIKEEQRENFPEVFRYWNSAKKLTSEIPEIVSKLNVFPDSSGLLRVKSKFDRPGLSGNRCYFPILLPKQSVITKLIVQGLHEELNHIGCYSFVGTP